MFFTMSNILPKQSGKKLAINSFYCQKQKFIAQIVLFFRKISKPLKILVIFCKKASVNIQALKMAVEISKAIFFLPNTKRPWKFPRPFFSYKLKMAMEISNANFCKHKMAMEISKAIVFLQTQNDHGSFQGQRLETSCWGGGGGG